MMIRRGTSLAAIGLLVAACSSGLATAPNDPLAGTSSGTASVGVTIYAAASLNAVLDDAKRAFEVVNPGRSLTISTDSSAALEVKIEQGAPADLFLSADTDNPQKLVERGLAGGAVTPFAHNLLTMIVPASNPAGIRTPADLARVGVKVIAAGDAVPISKYARRLVENLAEQPGYPADFVARYDANVVSREDNAAAVVAKIELGEGDAAIVYRTDARTSASVRAIDVPDAANVPVTYAGVVIRSAANATAARAFLDWFAGPNGAAVLTAAGFLPPD